MIREAMDAAADTTGRVGFLDDVVRLLLERG